MPTRWLIVNPYGVGDVLCSLPLVDAIRAVSPDAMIGFVCNRRTESLIHAYPGISETIVFEKDEYRALWRQAKPQWVAALTTLARQGRAGRWEVAFDLSMNWQLGAALAALGIPIRCGFDFRRRGRFLTHRLPLTGFDHRPVTEYYLDLLPLVKIPRPAGEPAIHLPIPDEQRHEAECWLSAHGIDGHRPIIGLVPGGGASWGPNAPVKQWPPPAFAVLADQLYEATGAAVALLGDAADQPLCKAVARQMRAAATTVPPAPSLLILGAILKRCRLVVGNDSGALHLAVAVGTPSVTIFGPANPVVYGPLPTQAARHRVVAKTLACRPCYARFRLPPCPWGIRCLTTLDPADVYQTATALLAA